jgi:hypothetical protein
MTVRYEAAGLAWADFCLMPDPLTASSALTLTNSLIEDQSTAL